MTTTAQRPAAAETAKTAGTGASKSSPVVRAGRRNSRRVAGGVLLVITTVVTFWQVDLRRHAQDSFLAVARSVAAGQVIAEADLSVVRVANSSDLQLLPAGQRAQVVGRTAAVPLATGSLLTAGQLGETAWPPAGQAVIAVPVKPGRAPAALTAGTRVVVLISQPTAQSATGAGNGSAVKRATATVVSAVEGGDQAGGQLVTLLLDTRQAETVAAASGEVALVQLGPGE
jgi:hypothetical protein